MTVKFTVTCKGNYFYIYSQEKPFATMLPTVGFGVIVGTGLYKFGVITGHPGLLRSTECSILAGIYSLETVNFSSLKIE